MRFPSWLFAASLLIPFGAHAQSYVVGLGNMTALNGVCHGPTCTDTDYITLTVEGPNGQKWSKTYGPNDLHKGNHTNWDLSSAPITVPADSKSHLTISWAAINKGHPADAGKLKSAADGAADGYDKSPDQQGSQNRVLIDVIVEAVKSAVGWATQDCDTALFNGKEVYDGQTLAKSGPPGYDGSMPPDLASKGKKVWFHVYDFLNIPSQCATGRYNQVVWVAQQ